LICYNKNGKREMTSSQIYISMAESTIPKSWTPEHILIGLRTAPKLQNMANV